MNVIANQRSNLCCSETNEIEYEQISLEKTGADIVHSARLINVCELWLWEGLDDLSPDLIAIYLGLF